MITLIPALRRRRGRQMFEFESSLAHIMSSKGITIETLSQQQQKPK